MTRVFKDYWSQFLNGLSALGIAIGSLGFTMRVAPLPARHERWEVWVFWSSIAGAVTSIYATAKNSQSLSRLTDERNRLLQSVARLQSLDEE
jgi:hypothetical protein